MRCQQVHAMSGWAWWQSPKLTVTISSVPHTSSYRRKSWPRSAAIWPLSNPRQVVKEKGSASTKLVCITEPEKFVQVEDNLTGCWCPSYVMKALGMVWQGSPCLRNTLWWLYECILQVCRQEGHDPPSVVSAHLTQGLAVLRALLNDVCVRVYARQFIKFYLLDMLGTCTWIAAGLDVGPHNQHSQDRTWRSMTCWWHINIWGCNYIGSSRLSRKFG